MLIAGSAIIEASDFAWDRFVERIAGLTDDEFRWEPAPGVPDIAWRVHHLAGTCLAGFAARLFDDDGELAERTVDLVSDLPDYLAAAYGAWRQPLSRLDDEALGHQLGSDWGPYGQSTRFDLALHVFDEMVHHAAEVALVRDLYSASR